MRKKKTDSEPTEVQKRIFSVSLSPVAHLNLLQSMAERSRSPNGRGATGKKILITGSPLEKQRGCGKGKVSCGKGINSATLSSWNKVSVRHML